MTSTRNNLAIDIGNSSIKIGHFHGSKLIKDWVCSSFEEVSSIAHQCEMPQIIICSVASDTESLEQILSTFDINILTASTPIPFSNHYKTKNTLGVDRIAAIAGAEQINGGKNNLVIDIGSCITYDFLDSEKVYHGGSISPGANLRFRAMSDYTKKLPFISQLKDTSLIGTSTEEAMLSGVFNGILAEIDGIIDSYQVKWPDLEVIMCGRGVNSFESKLKAHIFASPKLVLVGLNRILEYNEQS